MNNETNKSIQILPVPGSLSRSVQYDYSTVSLDARRQETVKNAVRCFGLKRYEEIKATFQEAYTEFAELGVNVDFDMHMMWMGMHGIRGFSQCAELALEWGLEPHIMDWEVHFNEWLETGSPARIAN